jgi:transcription antitermination factor NusG
MLARPQLLREPSLNSPFIPEQTADFWWVLRCETGRERAARQHLEQRGLENFVPTYTTLRRYQLAHRKPEPVEMVLFPSYVFARFPWTEKTLALQAPHIIDMLTFGPRAATIEDDEVRQIRVMAASGLAAPHPMLREGQRVEITSGPFRGVVGILAMQKGCIVVNFELLGRAVKINADPDMLRVAA